MKQQIATALTYLEVVILYLLNANIKLESKKMINYGSERQNQTLWGCLEIELKSYFLL